MTKFSPVIEPLQSDDAFIVANPNEFAYTGALKPLIFGYTSNEVIGFGPMHKSKKHIRTFSVCFMNDPFISFKMAFISRVRISW